MYDKERGLYIAYGNGPISLTGKMVNRHGLVAGATGTGKTVTLQVMAETFCSAGVPCFMADMKGDLSGISQPGAMSGFIEKRKELFGIPEPKFEGCPVRFFDVFGEQGHPMRATISQMGPQLISRILSLNETQEGVMNILFRIADDRGLLLIDVKDLRSMLNYIAQHASEYTTQYGNISTQSVGAIQRALLTLENQGGELFMAEPSFDIQNLLAVEPTTGKGYMNVLAADKLMHNPKLYSTFLLWLLSELYTTLPEVGDLELPKLVFFFDEAHMLFEDTSKPLTEKIEKVIRLIRSKGVGVYFVTQYPNDVPDSILGQLGNRVQHALRAYTPKDQKAVKVAAETFRTNPEFKTEEAITQLETGEALVSVLDEKGAPTVVQKAKILFPMSQIGPITEQQRDQIIKSSKLYGVYDKIVDRESAFEVLIKEAEEAKREQEALAKQKEEEIILKQKEKEVSRGGGKKNSTWARIKRAIITAITGAVATSVATSVNNKITGKKSKNKTSMGSKIVKNTTSSITRTITRDILGNLIK